MESSGSSSSHQQAAAAAAAAMTSGGVISCTGSGGGRSEILRRYTYIYAGGIKWNIAGHHSIYTVAKTQGNAFRTLVCTLIHKHLRRQFSLFFCHVNRAPVQITLADSPIECPPPLHCLPRRTNLLGSLILNYIHHRQSINPTTRHLPSAGLKSRKSRGGR